MKSLLKLIAVISAAGTLSTPVVLAQPGPGQDGWGPGHTGTNTNWTEWRKTMREEHQKTMAELKSMDATLDKDVARMNQAQGSAKTDAMAAVINDLVKEHDLIRDRMAAMHQQMSSRRQHRHQAMGGAEQGTGGTSSGTSAQPGKGR